MYEVLILLVVVNLGFTNYKPFFLDVVPVLAFARSGQFDGFSETPPGLSSSSGLPYPIPEDNGSSVQSDGSALTTLSCSASGIFVMCCCRT